MKIYEREYYRDITEINKSLKELVFVLRELVEIIKMDKEDKRKDYY